MSTQGDRSGTALDRIRLTGIAATGFHGVFEHERREGQTFVADVVVHLDTRRAAARDDLEHTLDYGALALEVVAVLEGEPADLIETVAERIAATVLAHAVVQGVDVAVHKPQAPITVPFGDVVVEIHRDRAKLPAAEPYRVHEAAAERAPRQTPPRTAAMPVVGAAAVPDASVAPYAAAASAVAAASSAVIGASAAAAPAAEFAATAFEAAGSAGEPAHDEAAPAPADVEAPAPVTPAPAAEAAGPDFPFDDLPAPIEVPHWAPIPGVSSSVDGEELVVAPAPADALPPGVHASASAPVVAAGPVPPPVPVLPGPPVPAPVPLPPAVGAAPVAPLFVPPAPAAPPVPADAPEPDGSADAGEPTAFLPVVDPDEGAPTAFLPAVEPDLADPAVLEPTTAGTAPLEAQPAAPHHAGVPTPAALALVDVVDGEIVLDVLDEVPPAPVDVVLALGANLGPAQETLRRAVHDLAATPGLEIVRVSPLARTAPVGGPEQPDFLNAVVLARTTLAARDLLRATQAVEQRHGRERHEHWGPRTLDVDIVLYGHVLAVTDDLELPHPRAHERAFVLQPWAEVDPHAVLPGLGGGPVAALAATAPDREGLRWLALDWLNGTAPVHDPQGR